ncbi:MAG: DinB family protein [Williamsia sp.]|nr:DinB family protein [Williamsia sp.]
MPTETTNTADLFSSIDETVSRLKQSLSSLPDDKINQVPYEGSWTVGMLYRHIIKSTMGLGQALLAPPKAAGRNSAARADELKKTFLNFSTKMKSPEMTVPEEGVYQKQDTLDKLDNAFRVFKENAASQNLDDLVTGLPLGDITKLELVHFILYHTQRHLHQMEKIVDALNKA